MEQVQSFCKALLAPEKAVLGAPEEWKLAGELAGDPWQQDLPLGCGGDGTNVSTQKTA